MAAHLDFVVAHLLFYAVDLLEVLLDLLKRFDLPFDFGNLTLDFSPLVALTDFFNFCDCFRVYKIHVQFYLADVGIFFD